MAVVSEGENELGRILRSEYRSIPILSQYPIKVGRKTLYLDYYLPTARIAFEYDGIQHEKYSRFFHGSREGFRRSQQNDRDKEAWCHHNNVTLVRLAGTVTVQSIRRKLMSLAAQKANLQA
jgi:very-short-patch-repair endonuclease